jgi:hypothetical protein
MVFIIALAGIAGFFFYDPLFYMAGIVALFLWIIGYVMGSYRFDSRLRGSSYASTMTISRILTMFVIAGILFFFFRWNGIAWFGIVFGILVPTKRKFSYEKTDSTIQS